MKAKQILNNFIPNSFSPKSQLENSSIIKDEKQMLELCKRAIKENPKVVQDFKVGKKEALNFLLGEIMKLSNRRADYAIAKEELIRMLK